MKLAAVLKTRCGVLGWQAVILLAACSTAASDNKDPVDPPAAAKTGVAVYALSRGKGVPEATRAALERARAMLEQARQRGEVSSVAVQRLGLEGETRLCAEFADPAQAKAMLATLRQVTQGVELMNLVVEPCDKAKQGN